MFAGVRKTMGIVVRGASYVDGRCGRNQMRRSTIACARDPYDAAIVVDCRMVHAIKVALFIAFLWEVAGPMPPTTWRPHGPRCAATGMLHWSAMLRRQARPVIRPPTISMTARPSAT